MRRTLFRLAMTMGAYAEGTGEGKEKCSLEQPGSTHAREVLEMHLGIEAEAGLDFFDAIRSGFEQIVHVMSGLQAPGVVCELAATELADFSELGTFGFHVFGDRADEIVNASFNPFCVQDDQALVFPAHLVSFAVIGCVYDSGSPLGRCLGKAQAARHHGPWQACFRAR